MRVLSLFSGIGAFEKALSKNYISYELVNYCEIDKYAARAYSLIHNIPESKNLSDVTKVDTKKLKDLDLITYGFPCQDLSNAGLQKGFTDSEGNTTRSGLFFEALRIIEETRPKIAIAENVKALTSKKFEAEFTTVLGSLCRLGYNNYFNVLNAKNYGIPQNRERVFIISIRQDLDKGFCFPQPFRLDKRLKDILEVNADDKYFLSEDRVNSLLKHRERNKEKGNGFAARFVTETDIASSLTTSLDKSAGQYLQTSTKSEDNGIVIKQVGNIYDDKERNFKNPQCGRVYDPDGLSPTLNTCQGGDRQPKVIIQTDKPICINSKGGRNGIEGLQPSLSDRIYSSEGIATACTTCFQPNVIIDDKQGVITEDLRIRKLTPLECFRLMGFDDRDLYILQMDGISDNQLYKMAGNSIVVDVLQAIFRELSKLYPDIFITYDLFKEV